MHTPAQTLLPAGHAWSTILASREIGSVEREARRQTADPPSLELPAFVAEGYFGGVGTEDKSRSRRNDDSQGRIIMTRRGLAIAQVVVIILILLNVAFMIIVARLKVFPPAIRAPCMYHLREIGMACTMFASDHGGHYPTVRAPGGRASNPMASLALLYDKYASDPKTFVCPGTTDNCDDLKPSQTLSPHGAAGANTRRQCSYGYDDTRGPNTTSNIVIAADAPPAGASGRTGTGASRNSDNHNGRGQNVLLYGGDIVIWITRTTNPMISTDDIYEAADPQNPGEGDSHVHQ